MKTLSELIKNSEERFISYKKLIEDVHKDKINFPPNDEFVIWYKNFLRENKNEEEIWLKKLISEKTNENQGINPPYCYKF